MTDKTSFIYLSCVIYTGLNRDKERFSGMFVAVDGFFYLYSQLSISQSQISFQTNEISK